MGLQLRIVAGPDEGKTFELKSDEAFYVGRGVDTQTKLHDPRVSRNHCSLHVEEEGVRLADAGSTGGTFVNGQRVSERHLRSGDIIRVGGTQIQFIGDDGDTLSWSAAGASRPTSDLMETREMKRVAVDPSDSEPRRVVAPSDDDTMRDEHTP